MGNAHAPRDLEFVFLLLGDLIVFCGSLSTTCSL